MRRFISIFLGLAAALPALADAPLSWGDQGDGTYRNPILPADYSDPDVIRVGEDFYLVASDFHFMGMQVLHSRDLVNWEIIGQVFDRLAIHPKYDEMNAYAQGTWAPTLRHHEGLFYVYVCTPHEGVFMWHSKDPAGPWSDCVTVKRVNRWEDPCPFWDDDGSAYLVRGQLGAGPLFLHRMSADGTRLLDEGVEIYRGPVAEGPKLFKRNGWYYISLPEGGVAEGGQTVIRSRSIYGPYERRVVLPDGSPHQGGLVELASGESWFVAFKSTGHLGRVPHLNPVRWNDDDWPVFGDGGRPVEHWRKPDVGAVLPLSHPRRSDEFDDPAGGLSPIWQWNHNPRNEGWSLTARPGWLRLEALPADAHERAHNTLTQKLWGNSGTVDTRIDLRAVEPSQRAGFAFLSGDDFGWIGVIQRGAARSLAWVGGEGTGVNLTGRQYLWLRGVYQGDRARLSYSFDGESFVDTGADILLRFGKWKGARIALYCFGPNGGLIDVDYVRYVIP